MKGSLAHPCSERQAPQFVQGTLVDVVVSVTLLETHGVPEKVASAWCLPDSVAGEVMGELQPQSRFQ